MAPIAQPYSQDACGIGSGAFSALGWAESRFGIDFLVVIFSIVVISIVVASIICATYFPLFAKDRGSSGSSPANFFSSVNSSLADLQKFWWCYGQTALPKSCLADF